MVYQKKHDQPFWPLSRHRNLHLHTIEVHSDHQQIVKPHYRQWKSCLHHLNTLKTLSRDIIHSTISTLRDSFVANRTFHIQIRNDFTFNRTFHYPNFEIKRRRRSDATYNLEAKSGQKACYNLTKPGNQRTNLKGANGKNGSRSSSNTSVQSLIFYVVKCLLDKPGKSPGIK